MKKIITGGIRKNDIIVIPAFGVLIIRKYSEYLFEERQIQEIRISFGWLCFRFAILIWKRR